MYRFKIEKIIVNTVEEKMEIIPKKINVIVGPNNSGKSRFLREIRDYISGENNRKIISDIEYTFPENFSDFDKAYNINAKIIRDKYGNWMLKSYSNKPNQLLEMTSTLESYFTQDMRTISEKEYFLRIINEKKKIEFLNWYGSLFYQYMGTEERLTICKKQSNYGLDTSSTNYLSSFKYKNDLLDDLSCKIKKLFKKDIYLDTRTLGKNLAFRIGENFDYLKNKANISEKEAFELFSETMLDEQGDGMKSFVSTFLSLNCNESDILLLDEPEAFLHPPLAHQLGEMIAESNNEERTIFVATHSIEILKGILSKNQDVNVIRITRAEENKNTFMILEQDTLKTILKNPLLRVSRVLEGIFCEKVIITEAEADELVYQELVEKIFPESGVFFAHGQNKQTLASIAELYQKIGVAYEIITDFDVLRVSKEFNKFLLLMPIDDKERDMFINYSEKLRKEIEKSVTFEKIKTEDIEKEKKIKRDEVYHKKGIRFFEKELQNKIQEAFSYFAKNHLHILETGELETLLEDYGVPYKEKKEWIIEAITKIEELKKEEITQESRLYKFIAKIIYNN